eukprot:sb/3479439/
MAFGHIFLSLIVLLQLAPAWLVDTDTADFESYDEDAIVPEEFGFDTSDILTASMDDDHEDQPEKYEVGDEKTEPSSLALALADIVKDNPDILTNEEDEKEPDEAFSYDDGDFLTGSEGEDAFGMDEPGGSQDYVDLNGVNAFPQVDMGTEKQEHTVVAPITTPDASKIETVQTEPAKVELALPETEAAVKVEPAKADTVKVEPAKVDSVKVEPAKVDSVKVEPAKVDSVKVEPAKVDSVKVEPTKVESVKVEPPKVDPVKVEPAKVEPVKVEPVKVDPVKVEPTKVDSVKVEPAKVDSVKVEPAKSDSVKVEPAKVDSVKVEPAKVDFVKVEPVKADSVKDEPAKADSVKVEPAKADSVKVEPAKKDSVKVEPVKVEPVKVEPVKADAEKREPVKDTPAPLKSGEKRVKTQQELEHHNRLYEKKLASQQQHQEKHQQQPQQVRQRVEPAVEDLSKGIHDEAPVLHNPEIPEHTWNNFDESISTDFDKISHRLIILVGGTVGTIFLVVILLRLACPATEEGQRSSGYRYADAEHGLTSVSSDFNSEVFPSKSRPCLKWTGSHHELPD